ncbi:MAG TPA: radical SAM protein, partial [Vicinamibacterales bacterium]|nr:radical SAM protein [Vicinamibacterales bacterium]
FGQLYSAGAPPFPPLDVPYLAAFLLSKGIPCEVIEAGALHLSTAAVCEQLGRAHAGALVLVRTSLPTIDWDLQVCADIRNSVRPAGLGLFGAAVPSLLRRIESDEALDYVVLGEPDGTAAELATGAPLDQIAGLMYRDGRRWARNAERPLERELDSIPFPRWDLLPVDRYVIPKSSTSGRMRFLPMLSSRGCPFGCSYCPYPIGQGLKWRFRSPKNVVDEMEHLVRTYGVEHILFRDPMFSMQQKRVVEICDEIVRRGLKVTWKCETRIDCLDEATIAAMARAGCTGVNFGVESIDPEIQKGVHRKPILIGEFKEKVAILRRFHIDTFAFFVVGLPGDTLQTILDSMEFAVEMKANWTQFTVATPFIGTPMHDWAVKQGFIAPDFYQIRNAHTSSPGNENLVAADIERLHRFSKILQELLLNRKGLFKNERRRNLGYRAVKSVLDGMTHMAAVGALKAGRWHFERTIKPIAPRGTMGGQRLPVLGSS